MTLDGTNYSPTSVEDTPAPAVRPDAGKTSGEMVDYLYQELRKRSLIEYGSVIDVELIREIVDLPEPNIHGLAPKEIRKAFQDDSLALLTLSAPDRKAGKGSAWQRNAAQSTAKHCFFINLTQDI